MGDVKKQQRPFILFCSEIKLGPKLDDPAHNERLEVVTTGLSWKAQDRQTILLPEFFGKRRTDRQSSFWSSLQRQVKGACPQGENYCSANCCSNLTHNLAVGIDALQCQTLSYTKGEREEKKKTTNTTLAWCVFAA